MKYTNTIAIITKIAAILNIITYVLTPEGFPVLDTLVLLAVLFVTFVVWFVALTTSSVDTSSLEEESAALYVG